MQVHQTRGIQTVANGLTLVHANPSFHLRRWRMVAAPTLLAGQTHLATRAVTTSPEGGVEVAQSLTALMKVLVQKRTAALAANQAL